MRISVCITHYNRPHTLGRTLESLAEQTRQADEIFLWDDCSPQDPSGVVTQWQAKLPQLVYHRNETNLGMPGNLNAVIEQATGDYVANLHDSDVYHPQLLEKWSAALDRHPDAGLVFCRDSRWENPRFVHDWRPEPPTCLDGPEFFRRYFLGRIDSILWGTVMARRSIYEKLLPFDQTYLNWADVDMWMRFCGEGAIAFLPEQLIELDANPTHGVGFSFVRMRRMQAMLLQNIEHLFAGEERARAFAVQRQTWRRLWRRWMLGRLKRGEWAELKRGWEMRAES